MTVSSPSNAEESSRSTVSKSTTSLATLRVTTRMRVTTTLSPSAISVSSRGFTGVVVVDGHAELVEDVADGERGDPRLRDLLAGRP